MIYGNNRQIKEDGRTATPPSFLPDNKDLIHCKGERLIMYTWKTEGRVTEIIIYD